MFILLSNGTSKNTLVPFGTSVSRYDGLSKLILS